METAIEITKFTNNAGELSYEIAIDDGLDTRLLEVTAEEAISLLSSLGDVTPLTDRDVLA